MGDVTAVNMDVVTDKSGHVFTPCAVSVCITPAAPAPLPIPYPVVGSTSDGATAPAIRTSINGAKVITVGSVFTACHGNEAGTLKEVVSLNTGGPCLPLIGAPTVLTELGMQAITGSFGIMNKGITVGPGGSTSGADGSAGSASGGGGGGGSADGNKAPGPSGGGGSGGGGSGSGASAGGGADKSSTQGKDAAPGAGSTATAAKGDPKVDKMTAGLDPSAKAQVDKSPTLKKQLGELHDDGWKVKQGDPGKGSFADRKNKEIVLDPNLPKDQQTQVLAHEAGHAKYTPDPYVPPTGKTKQEYVDANVKNSMKDEGEATYNNCKVRDEVKQNGGGDIGVAGANSNGYIKSYDDSKQPGGSKDKAVGEMANGFGNEKTSTTGESYNDYYGKPYADHYDKTNPPPAGGGGGP